MRKKIKIKNKITNHLTHKGEKAKGEKTLLKSVKDLQKNSKKQSKKLIKLAVIFSSPIFKLHKITHKKRKKKKNNTRIIPGIILSEKIRISLGIKLMLSSVKKKKISVFSKGLEEEILSNAQHKSESIETKKKIQTQVLLYKHITKYFRWN